MAGPAYNCIHTASHDDSGNLDISSCLTAIAVNAGTAALTSDMSAANADPTLTAVTPGDSGNDIAIVYTDPGASGESLSIDVSGTIIVASLATHATTAAITTTCNALKIALDATTRVASLITVAVEGTGLGVINAKAKASLTGGAGGCQYYDRINEHCFLAQVAEADARKLGYTAPTG